MTELDQIKARFVHELLKQYGKREATALFNWALEAIDGFQQRDVLMGRSTERADEYANCLADLVRGVPIQYHFGSCNFMGLKLQLNNNVLIPRPETEELVHWVIKDVGESATSIQDLGTGSGCIALGLAQELVGTEVLACDVSEQALALANSNANNLGLAVDFYKCDMLNERPRKTEVLVSNPPYIPIADKQDMASHVLEHEPHLALFVPDNDPLVYYRRIAEFSMEMNCRVYVEIHEAYKVELEKMLRNFGLSYEFKKDLQGKYRMLKWES